MEQDSVEVGGVRLAVRRWGRHGGRLPTAVLLPALGETVDDWREVAEQLRSDRDVLAVDLRGHGGSDRPGTYSLESMSGDICALLAGFAEPVDLIGHSLGGLVAWWVAASEPGRVRRLVLEDVGLLRPRRSVVPDRPAGPLDFDWAVVEQVRPQIDDPGPGWRQRATAVVAPTLVIGGGPASHVPQRHVAELSAAIPDARLITIDAGHEVHARQPARFVAAVRSFLDVPSDHLPR